MLGWTGGVWLFLGVLEDVISGDPLVAADLQIHAALQQLRFPLLDSLMIGASEMGDTAVTVPVIAVVFAWLLWQARLRSALYWIAAVGFAQLFVVALKAMIRRPRPALMYDGVHSFSFPSNHATLSIVTYGFLAFFVARAWGTVAGSALRLQRVSSSFSFPSHAFIWACTGFQMFSLESVSVWLG